MWVHGSLGACLFVRAFLCGLEVNLICKGRELFRTSTAILGGCAPVQSYQKLPS